MTLTRPLMASLFAVAALAALPASAEEPDDAPQSVTAVSPIFSQLVGFSQPASFVVVFEKPTADNYIREAVLQGETTGSWSQMITVTGAKGLAEQDGNSPKDAASRLAGGFQAACPKTFLAEPLGDMEISGYNAFAAIASCGTAPGGAHSETALIVTIEGEHDYYTLQWAERGPAGSPAIDAARWRRRLDALGPILLCDIVPGEKAPYPSCTE
jgi:hypothetical protein